SVHRNVRPRRLSCVGPVAAAPRRVRSRPRRRPAPTALERLLRPWDGLDRVAAASELFSRDPPPEYAMIRTRTAFLLLALAPAVLASHAKPAPQPDSTWSLPAAVVRADTTFARTIERLSEPGGYFDSDNL